MANIGEPLREWEITPEQEPIGIPQEDPVLDPVEEPELVPVGPGEERWSGNAQQ